MIAGLKRYPRRHEQRPKGQGMSPASIGLVRQRSRYMTPQEPVSRLARSQELARNIVGAE